jgi:hypothetical protein
MQTVQFQQQKTPSVTFAVSEVKRATEPLPESEYADALAVGLAQDGTVAKLEAYSRDTKRLVSLEETPANAFLHAFNLAFDEHRPIVLSPDMIWLVIAQGVALHINGNAEAMRGRFAAHEGKANITVRRDEFVRGFAGNSWEGVFAEFSEQIRTHVGERSHSLVARRFSTTGVVERAAFEVTLMDAFQSYFNYDLVTLCGIPQITLEGTPDDWQSIREGAEALADYELGWWTKHLLPVLDQFVAASRGDADLSFWRDIYKIDDDSGGPHITGSIVNLFPYIVHALPPRSEIEAMRAIYQNEQGLSPANAQKKIDKMYNGCGKTRRNPHLGWRPEFSEMPMCGITSNLVPSGLATAPFTWTYLGTKLPMQFVAGFVGVAQDRETLALRPEIGWAVRDAPAIV